LFGIKHETFVTISVICTQALNTIPVIDSSFPLAHITDMLTHEEILAELIRQIDAGDLKQAEVAKRLGIPASRVAEMRKGLRKLQPKEMKPLAVLLGLTKGSELRQTNYLGDAEIPILGKVAAGVWLEQSLIDPIEARRVIFDKVAGGISPDGLFAVVPEGDSMNLAFPANAVLVCRHLSIGDVLVKSGDLVIVEREAHNLREMTCKRLSISSDGDYLLNSESTNPKFAEPIKIPCSIDDEFVDTGVSIMARVIRVIINYD